MGDIRKAIPRPTPVTLGGRRFLASELRLGDVAEIADWIADRIPSPYDEAGAELEFRPDRGREWKRLLSATIDRQQEWPPEPGSPGAEALLRSDEGNQFLVLLALQREHPGLGPTDVAAFWPDVTQYEFSRLSRVAWGVDPLRIMATFVDGPGEEGSGDGPDWLELWHRWTTTGTSVPFAELTIQQLITFRCGGEVPPASYVDPQRADFMEVGRRRRAFFAEIEEPDDGSPHCRSSIMNDDDHKPVPAPGSGQPDPSRSTFEDRGPDYRRAVFADSGPDPSRAEFGDAGPDPEMAKLT